MIVVDTNVLAYLWIRGAFSPLADRCWQRDPDWVAPSLWRSELRNVLTLYLRKKLLDLATAQQIMQDAEVN